MPAARLDALTPGDEIDVRVFDEPQLSNAHRLAPAGTVTLRYCGDVQAGGKTCDELARDIERCLADGYLRQPHVTVTLVRPARTIRIIGAVNRPGTLPFTPGMTLVQALLLAGNLAADAERVVVLARGDGARRFAAWLDTIVAGEAPDVPLLPDDVLWVPKR